LNLDSIIERIKPSQEERRGEAVVVERVIGLLRPYEVKPILVGSLAKDTDLAGNKDIDIFIQFDPQVPRDELEKQGLRIAKDVFKRLGAEYEIDYAEHPYVKGAVDGHLIEIVPCYSGDRIISAVDRTPFHTEYVKARLAGNRLNDEIRLTKQFMRGIGVYGAEAKVEGFSGYLVELLVLNYGSFIKTLEAAKAWTIPQTIDIERLWEDREALPKFFTNAGLIVVDPVDRNRNVAAAVSGECLSRFIVKSNDYVLSPDESFFFPKPKRLRSPHELRHALEARGSKFFAIVFRHGKINANTVYAQLRKTGRHIASEMESLEFKVFRHGFWTNEADASVLLFELEVWELPELVHRVGPPLNQDPVNQERFTEKYKADAPYVKDGRWVVDTGRAYRRAADLLPDIISGRKGFGKNLRELEDASLLADEGLFSLEDPGWLGFLNEYLN
jgi:tRNA nucleotidyltransferase (CCA-adding enzyme)